MSGTGFTGATSAKIGSLAASPANVTATSLVVTVPQTAASGKIAVTTPVGTATSTQSFTVVKTPAITGIAPASATVGATLTISGVNLGGVSDVHFVGGDQHAVPTAATPTQVKVVVPAGARTGKIEVTNPAGKSAPSAATFKLAPKIDDVSPLSAPPGQQVTVTGSGFDGVASVKIGTRTVAAAADGTGTHLTVTVPTPAPTGQVVVGTATSAQTFTGIGLPTLTSITPASAEPGMVVTITGTNLGSVTAVTFPTNVPAGPLEVVSPTAIRVAVPDGVGSGFFSVTNPAGTATSTFSFGVPIGVSKLQPVDGAPGTEVTVTGVNLDYVSAVDFGGVPAVFQLGTRTRRSSRRCPRERRTGRWA